YMCYLPSPLVRRRPNRFSWLSVHQPVDSNVVAIFPTMENENVFSRTKVVVIIWSTAPIAFLFYELNIHGSWRFFQWEINNAKPNQAQFAFRFQCHFVPTLLKC